jgi:hypothetical protein
MVISHKYTFIFIKTLKTAGTSLEAYLSSICDAKDVFTPIYPELDIHKPRNFNGLWNILSEIKNLQKSNQRKESLNDFLHLKKYWNHIPAYKLQYRVPANIWNSYFKFTIERDPLEKVVSHYYMMKFNLNKNNINQNYTIEEYFNEKKYLHVNNKPIYTNWNNGKVMVDKIIKYEKLDIELSEVFKKLDVPWQGSLNIHAKSNYRPSDTKPENILSKSQIQLINDINT